jgi:hypothetical protein
VDWVLIGIIAVTAAAGAAGCLLLYYRKRKRAVVQGSALPSMEPTPNASASHAQNPGVAAVPPGKHIPPRIVSASGPPPPRPRPLDPEARPELPGAQPRVAKEASEEEEEAGELEDMTREAIASTKMMVDTLLAAGKDVSAALRQLAASEEFLERGQAEEALKYASKAMDVAESLEAEQDRCPRCRAETKPRWRLCPKCGQPLR